jgi:hypothetical protein
MSEENQAELAASQKMDYSEVSIGSEQIIGCQLQQMCLEEEWGCIG